MKFGLLYEMQLPRPWKEKSDYQQIHEAVDEIELADQLGYDYIWANEHHFLEEYSHSSAPEVFLGFCARNTKQIRLGHAVVLSPPGYNQPARVAERIGTLDLVSNGRVDFGTGESASRIELEGYGVDPDKKKAMWAECTEQTANMMVMDPYPGFKGDFFSMPARNVIPKPIQKPHPPIWVACSRRETIHAAARAGIGALAFAFIDPEEASKWVSEYYDIIKSEECVPIGHSVNANIAMCTGFSVHEDPEEAKRRGAEGFQYFGYSLGHYYVYGHHTPGKTNIWERFKRAQPDMEAVGAGRGVGTPEQIRKHLQKFSDVGVDQVIFIQQSGKNEHEHICDSLKLFAKSVMPHFKNLEKERERKKEQELAPHIEAALARKQKMSPATSESNPEVVAYGRSIIQSNQDPAAKSSHHSAADIMTPLQDPLSPAAD